jgi:hypothetical protein
VTPGQEKLAQQLNGVSLAEFKPVPCLACGALRRRVVSWVEHLVHRFKSELVATLNRSAWFCVGCKAQVDDHGKALPIGHPDLLPKREVEQFWR